jgi:fumarate hydratase class I
MYTQELMMPSGSKAYFNTYQEKTCVILKLPISMFEEKNSVLIFQRKLIFIKKGATYEFLFLAKGGGSANKTYLYQQNKIRF